MLTTSMKKNLKRAIDLLLKRRGLRVIKQYEFDHLEIKYKELISETQDFFKEFIFQDLKYIDSRLNFLSKLYGTEVPEAFYIIYFLQKTAMISGDVCEFGIANGATSALIANEILKSKKDLWLFDSFQGLSKPGKKDILLDDIFKLGFMERYQNSMCYSVDEVKHRLSLVNFPQSRTKIVEGFIENTIKGRLLPKKISFVFIDFDLYQPTRVALLYINRVIVKGGVIIIDDYNFFSKGAKTAVDEFYKAHKTDYKRTMPAKFAGYFIILERIR